MMSHWVVSKCVGITTVLIWFVIAQCDAVTLKRHVSSNDLGVSINSNVLSRGEVAVGGPNNPTAVDFPISDLAPRSGEVPETGLAPYVDVENDIPQLRVSDQKISLFGIAIGASVAYAALICATMPTACLIIGAVSVIVSWLAVFAVDGHITKPTSNERSIGRLLLEPGDYHKLNVGEGFYEMDNLLLPFANNDNNTLAHLQYHLGTMRSLPRHIIELKHTEDGIVSIRSHLPHSLDERNFESLKDENPIEDEGPETRSMDKEKGPVMVNHLTYAWNRSNREKYHKLGKRDQRKSDGKKLGKALGRYIAHQRYKAYCVTFHDKKNKADVNKGTFYINKGKGVSKHCESK